MYKKITALLFIIVCFCLLRWWQYKDNGI